MLLAVHAVAAICAPLLVRWIGRNAFYVLALAPFAAFVWALAHTPDVVLQRRPVVQVMQWVPELSLNLAFTFDTLAWVMVLIVSGIGALIIAYCARYFKDTEPGLGLFAGVFVAFAGAMFGLVTTDDVMVLFIFWELTTVLSYLLIGHYIEKKSSRRAALNALIATTAGGLSMMIGLLMVAEATGTYRISGILDSAQWGQWAETSFPVGVQVAIVLILAGAISKSALFPTHFWLPGAMAAPTPVSAYLHAAAMVKAGVYLVLRLVPIGYLVPVWPPLILVLGGITMLLGAYRAFRQTDIKLLLAYGTVSQLGFMMMISGVGSHAASLAAIALIISHALFKAALFMVVGVVDKATGTRDIGDLSGLGRRMPAVAAVAIVSAASMAAVPPIYGFVAKESVYASLTHGGPLELAALAVMVAGSMITVGYSWRFVWGTFAAKKGTPDTELHPVGIGFWGPPALLGLLSAVLGFFAGPLERLLLPIADRFPAGEHPGHLALWAGVNPALLLSVLTLAVGALLCWRMLAINRTQETLSPESEGWGQRLEAERAFRSALRGVDHLAVSVTARTQRGSLPVIVGIAFTVVIALVGGLWIFQPADSVTLDVVAAHTPVEIVLAIVIAAAAIEATRSRRRLRAMFLVSITGYGLALLFLIAGSPDVALTQTLVETVTLLVFVLVLRRLPLHFSKRPFKADQLVRWGISIGVAVVLCGAALLASNARTAEPTGPGLVEAGYTQGGGYNTVNVTLVDARVWDTMGEISVLLVAATGIASLIFINRREQSLLRVSEDTTPGSTWRFEHGVVPNNVLDFDTYQDTPDNRWKTWLVGGGTLAPERRMVVFEVLARILFPLVMVFSVYLLFAGHNQPGGGFAAGLVGGLALAIRYLAGGRFELAEAMPIQAGTVLGIGLVLAVGAGIVPALFGAEPFTSVIFDFTMPVYGDVHFPTPLVFDAGVYLVVLGLLLDILRSLGTQIDRMIEHEAETSNAPAAEAI